LNEGRRVAYQGLSRRNPPISKHIPLTTSRPAPLGVLARLRHPAVPDWARITAYGALPTLGLVAGPSYSALVFGAGVICFLHDLAFGRGLPRIDRRLAALAILFVLLCVLGASWSIVPRVTLLGAGQVAAILAGALIFLSIPRGRDPCGGRADALFTTLLLATLAGGVLMIADWATGFHFQEAISHRADAATKYNRGIDYLVLLAWPVLGYFCWRRVWGRAALLAAIVGVVSALGASLAGQVAALAGLATLGVAFGAPRLIGGVLQGGIVLFAASWPFVLRALASERAELAYFLKRSAAERLEIWDYMTAAVLKHPIHGWGLLSSKSLPIPPGPLWRFLYLHGQFVFVPGPGTNQHDQWLELWVETGLLGAALGAALAVLVVRSVRSLDPALRPFAYASIVAALVISCVNFEITTDSWWAALAATGFLFLVLGRVTQTAQSRMASVGPALGLNLNP
jgi:O-antigen ligase